MANYKDIKGFHVQSLSTDPTASQVAGGSWATGGALTTGRYYVGSAGTQTAALLMGGDLYPTTPRISDKVESYNGSSWTETAEITARRGLTGFGTNTSAIAAGGYISSPSDLAESWNGSAWTEVSEINTSRYALAGAGASNTSGVVFGGASPAPGQEAEKWDGSSWTESGDLNTSRNQLASCGIITAALAIGGNPTAITNVESYNGSTWTEIAALNTGTSNGGGAGTTTLALCFGGSNPSGQLAKTEAFDGTSWTEISDLGTARNNGGGIGTQAAALFAGGNSGSGGLTATEAFDTGPATFQKLNEGQVYYNSSSTNAYKVTQYNYPAGTFASGGDLNQKRYGINGCGNQTAALVAGGDTYDDSPRATADSETYNGTAWTEGSDLNEASQGSRQAGTTTASVLVYANSPYGTELYNGASWSDNPSTLNTPRGGPGGMGGVQTAALFCGGYPTTGKVEEFNGSSWSEKADLNTARYSISSVGTTTAMLSAGGDVPPYSALTETYDGTSWTETGDMPVGRSEMGIIGSTGSAMACMGSVSPPAGPSGIATGAPSQSFWNGSTWTAGSGYPAQYRGGGGCGPASSGLFYGGIGTPNDSVTTTNEWTAQLANKTITVG